MKIPKSDDLSATLLAVVLEFLSNTTPDKVEAAAHLILDGALRLSEAWGAQAKGTGIETSYPAARYAEAKSPSSFATTSVYRRNILVLKHKAPTISTSEDRKPST